MLQNIPFALSIICQLVAVTLTARAETKILDHRAGVTSPSLGSHIGRGWREWWAETASELPGHEAGGAEGRIDGASRAGLLTHLAQSIRAYQAESSDYNSKIAARELCKLTGIEKDGITRVSGRLLRPLPLSHERNSAGEGTEGTLAGPPPSQEAV